MDVGLVPVEKLHSIYDGFSPVNIFGNFSSLYFTSNRKFTKTVKIFSILLKKKKKIFPSILSLITFGDSLAIKYFKKYSYHIFDPFCYFTGMEIDHPGPFQPVFSV